MKYIFGESFVQPQPVVDEVVKEVEEGRRRSKRSRQGTHRKFGKEENTKAAMPIQKEKEGGGSDGESVMSDLTTTLEAFEEEMEESEEGKRKADMEEDAGVKRRGKGNSASEALNCELCGKQVESMAVLSSHVKECDKVQVTEVDLKERESLGWRLRKEREGLRKERAKDPLDMVTLPLDPCIFNWYFPKVGDYHLKSYFTYLAKDEAVKLLPSYYSTLEGTHTCKV